MSEDAHDNSVEIIYCIFLLTLVVFTIIGAYMEQKHFIFGHETGVIILLGMLISYIAYKAGGDSEDYAFNFNITVFFDLALPLILFAAGFNMRRKEFFDNFVNITKFGIFGSLFTYVFFVGSFYLLFEYVDMGTTDKYVIDEHGHGHTEHDVVFKPEILDIMLFCSILVSSDIVAAMSILKFDECPHIFSIILGEGLFNDVVVFTLF